MGNVQSRKRYYEVAYDALLNARDLEYEFGGPPSQGAILAYLDGAISARRTIRDCTPLEANEFYRLALPVARRWTELNVDKFLCQPVRGRCQHPDEFLHRPDCRYRVQLPPGIEYPPPPGPQRGNGHQGHSNPFGPPPGHRDNYRIHAGGYYGYSESDYEYSEDEDGAVYSDEEDLYARSMSQASDYGFAESTRRGGAGRGGASRGGPSGAHGRAPQGRAPNAGVARGDDGTAPSRAPRSGPSGAGADRGGDAARPGGASRGVAPTALNRAPRSGPSNTGAAGGDDDGTAPGASHRGARGDDGAAPNRAPRREPSKAAAARGDGDGAAPAGTSRRETPNGGAAHGDGAGNRGGTSHGQPPRQPNPRTAVFEDVSKDDSADPGIAASRGSASREGAATGASYNGPRASHGGRRRH